MIAVCWAVRLLAADEATPVHPLVWDAIEKTVQRAAGETSAAFDFTVANTSDAAVTIEQIRPTCGCTVAEMPSSPWVLAPHASGTFTGVIDLRGRAGGEVKAIFVNSSSGTQTLRLKVAAPDVAARQANQKVAMADRQAVFAGDCARCHAEPARAKRGAALFTAACGVCHLAVERADFVPNLLVAREPRDAAYWRRWITEGKAGTLMPAWARDRGGPLTNDQIDSLVAYLVQTLPSEPRRQ